MGVSLLTSERLHPAGLLFLLAMFTADHRSRKVVYFSSPKSDFAVTVASSHPLSQRDYYHSVLFVSIEPMLPNK
jgi:hypothetical protein